MNRKKEEKSEKNEGDEESNEVYNQIKELREEMALTQKELADELGISRQSLISLEKGRYLPSFPLALLLEEFFERSISDIFSKMDLSKEEEDNKGRGDEDIRRVNINFNKRGGIMNKNWSPFEELNRMHEELDRAFGQTLGQAGQSVFPKVNVYQEEDKVVVEAEVPGMDEDDLEIDVTKDSVRNKKEKKEEKEVKEKNYHQKETSYGSFDRVVSLPVEVENEKAKAKLSDGALKVKIPSTKKKGKTGKKVDIEKKE